MGDRVAQWKDPGLRVRWTCGQIQSLYLSSQGPWVVVCVLLRYPDLRFSSMVPVPILNENQEGNE